MKALRLPAHASPVAYLFRFRGPRYPPRFVSRSLRSRSRKVGGGLPGRGHCSAGDPIAGLLSRGRERDLPGSRAVHPVPLPRSRTPTESTIPRLFVGLIDAAPASRTAKASACQLFRGSITRLQHLLPTLQEWCCHHPCKARFRLAGLPLPGGSRTLWIALKGFRSYFHSPFLDFSWRYRDELPPFNHSITSSAVANSVSGTVRPRALAVLRLRVSSILTACCTGRSAAFSPLRM